MSNVCGANKPGDEDQPDFGLANLTLDADTEDRYRMDRRRRGRFIIINNEMFEPETKQDERAGSGVDASNLYNDFTQLGFDVHKYCNLKSSQMLQLMIAAAGEDHTDRDCFAVAVLSHGDDGTLYGTDGIIPVDKFLGPIKSCQSLAGKPKIFIVQACRGNELDSGMEASDAIAEEQRPPQRIPIEADFLYAYSTTPGYYAWRNSTYGSWFIQALHRMMEKFRDKPLDFVSLLTRVNREVAYGFESRSSKAYMTRKKQVPSIVSMLTKDLYLTPKEIASPPLPPLHVDMW